MLSIAVIGAGNAAHGYALYQESEVVKNCEDYYVGEGDVGMWLGGAAQEMRLVGVLEFGQLLVGLQGFNPGTGEALSKNAGLGHKGGWDLTFSSPKSVSCIWAISDLTDRVSIESAQNKAAEKALSFLEENGAFLSRSRTDPGPVGGVLAARFMHGTSREADPQLHTHCAVLNLQPDGGAMDFDTRWKIAAGAVYRAELAAELQKMGFSIESDGKSFRVVGVPQPLEREFSTRRSQIEEALTSKGLTSAKAAEVAALDTRKFKGPATRAELSSDWQQRAEIHGFNCEAVSNLKNLHLQQTSQQELGTAEILNKLTEQASTFTPQQLAAAVAVEMQGRGGAEAVKSMIWQVKNSPDLMRLESEKPRHLMRGEPTELRYTTLEMLRIESGILSKSQARQGEISHSVPVHVAIVARPTMTEEQKTALHHACEKPGAVQIVEGMAGTGKSYLLGAARESWEQGGFAVIGAALAGKAAAGLEAGAGIKSQTVHSFLAELDQGRLLTSKTVIVIDEAGMVGSRQMARVLDHVHQAGAKAVLVGDSKQLQPIDAGGSFRLLSQHLGAARLENIQRQMKEADRQVVRDFADGKSAEALKSMQDRGLLKTSETRSDAMIEMVRDWAKARDPGRPGESLMLAATRAEVKQINAMAREMLKSEGRLAGGMPAQTMVGMKEFAVGERIIFTRNNAKLGVKNGELATVCQIQFNQSGELEITTRLDDGRIAKFEVGEGKKQFSYLDYGYAMSVHKSQGVTVDRAFVLPSESMSSREWSYVSASRARFETRIYTTTDQMESLTRTMSRSDQKTTSLDYSLAADSTKQLQAAEAFAP
jgi:Ti-type conjugative transfer relaxase TraA